MQLVSTEVSEAVEGVRKNLMDDHLPQYKMECVELADTLIRVLDLGGKLKLTYTERPINHPFIGEDKSIGCNHLAINCEIVSLANTIYLKKMPSVLSDFYSTLINCILEVAKVRGHNLAKPLVDKLELNKNRADHKRENRNKKNGKKF